MAIYPTPIPALLVWSCTRPLTLSPRSSGNRVCSIPYRCATADLRSGFPNTCHAILPSRPKFR